MQVKEWAEDLSDSEINLLSYLIVRLRPGNRVSFSFRDFFSLWGFESVCSASKAMGSLANKSLIILFSKIDTHEASLNLYYGADYKLEMALSEDVATCSSSGNIELLKHGKNFKMVISEIAENAS